MSTKLIAIGNKLMGDDGIAIYVAEKLKLGLEEKGVEVIIGETDFEYCLDKIDEDDRIIILDATYFDLLPGTVSKIVLCENYKQKSFSEHGYSLIKAIRDNYQSTINNSVLDDAIIIGIEGSSFEFSLTLSKVLQENFDKICKKVEWKVLENEKELFIEINDKK